jgi:hypothetical protein
MKQIKSYYQQLFVSSLINVYSFYKLQKSLNLKHSTINKKSLRSESKIKLKNQIITGMMN